MVKQYLKKNKINFIITSLFILVDALLTVYIAFILKDIINLATNNNMDYLYRYIFFVLEFIVLFGIIIYFKNKLINKFIYKFNISIQNTIFENIFNIEYSEFESENTAKYISIFENDIKLLDENYLLSLFSLVKNMSLVIIGVLAMFFLSWKMALTVIFVSFIPIIISNILGGNLSYYQNRYRDNYRNYLSHLKDSLTNFPIIKSFNMVEQICMDNEELLSINEKSRYEYSLKNNKVESYTNLAGNIIVFAIFFIGIALVIKGQLVIATLLAFIQLTNYILSPIEVIGINFQKIKSCKSLIESFNDFSDKQFIKNNENVSLPNFNKLDIKNLSLSFDEKDIFKDISLTIEKGYKYALIGENGSGKSSLLKCINNLYCNYSGSIKVENIDIRKIKHEDFFSKFTYLQQDPLIFNGDLKLNICMGSAFEKDKYDEIVKKINLEYLDGKLLKVVSGGEKQRIAIGRALYKDTDILSMDESFSALDSKSQVELKEIVNQNFDTIIEITHDISQENLNRYDKIIEIKDCEVSVK